jgi:FMN phosphatase YigB (HAD superfamily)
MSIIDSIKVAFFDLGKTLVLNDRTWIPGARDTLKKMSRKKIRLGLISNTGTLSRAQILALLPPDFDMSMFEEKLVIFSSEVHVEKPNARIFQMAIEHSGVEANECLFCTEEPDHIVAAKKVGMQTALVNKGPDSDIGGLFERLSCQGMNKSG